jgi:hypothetical protein
MTKKSDKSSPADKLEKAVKADPVTQSDIGGKGAGQMTGRSDVAALGPGEVPAGETPEPLTKTPSDHTEALNRGYIGRLPDADGN